ncbi:ankyrin repeat and SOCS box protein 11 [Aplysia californica]|uniref:Ankyrin repeat and SOCS box protein 11 n=1 Tax=Aplysia californica TaxID=6500 RepID=A0ABM0JM06_APLCA|nr:ankyrin repeat and SOCS box protein 11 [Aplysia californica]XP_012937044.1 ankyrin repeat and SOCS box protein 11 [Aplysia californica]XP_012937045.1 ankyrin repeat and SOCS box protein 11 [Aplysia californica]
MQEAIYFYDSAQAQRYYYNQATLQHTFYQEFSECFVQQAFEICPGHEQDFADTVRKIDAARPGFVQSWHVGFALMRAIAYGRPDVIISLLYGGVDVNQTFRGRSMVHEAVKQGNSDMLEFVLSLPGIEKDAYDVTGKTALMHATGSTPECLKVLLDAGCNMFLKDGEGNSAIHQPFKTLDSSCGNVVECLDMLLRYGAHLGARGAQGKTCLQRAVEMGNHLLVHWLIMRNVDLQQHVTNVHIILDTQLYRSRDLYDNVLLLAVHQADRKLMEVLIACGCSFRHYSWLLPYCKSFRMLHASLQGALSQVGSLQSLCRAVIRPCLSNDIERDVACLGIPRPLQSFLLCRGETQVLVQDSST